MSFVDESPFAEKHPDLRRQYGISPSVGSGGRIEGRQIGSRRLERRDGRYRLIIRGTDLPGLADRIRVGRVTIWQATGPITTQKTVVVQKPGWRRRYTKWMEHPRVGDGEPLTVATIDVVTPRDLFAGFESWHNEAMGAVACLTALLDQRIAQRVLAEDLLIYDKKGKVVTQVDRVLRLRHYPPSRVLEQHREVLLDRDGLDLDRDPRLRPASRWYLRAVQGGPRPDAIVSLWIALESLSKGPTDENESKTDLQWVEAALSEMGIEVAELEPSLGRIYGQRSRIVQGELAPEADVGPAYYTLEAIARGLLRFRAGLGAIGFPLHPDVPNLKSPWRGMALLARRLPPRTSFTEAPTAEPGSRPGLRESPPSASTGSRLPGVPPKGARPGGPDPTDTRGRDRIEPSATAGITYRLGFQSMTMPGLPERIVIGNVVLVQTDGPVLAHAGGQPRPVGAGLRLSVCHLAVEGARKDLNGWVRAQRSHWRYEAKAAIGLLAAFFDERLAREEVFEDVVAGADGELPSSEQRVNETQHGELDPPAQSAVKALERVEDALATVGSAAWWYLRAVQEGPTADAIIYLWIALEDLGASGRSRATSLRRALSGAGAPESLIDRVRPREAARVRGEVLHTAAEAPNRLSTAFMGLEAATRHLIRARLGITSSWPVFTSDPL